MATVQKKPGDAAFQPKEVPSANTGGYPQTGIKTKGIVTRGNGAAVKGKTARGPMA